MEPKSSLPYSQAGSCPELAIPVHMKEIVAGLFGMTTTALQQ